MRKDTRGWLKECSHSLDFEKIKNEILSLFREPEIMGRRKQEILFPCEWLMGEMRTYSDYEAVSLTPKVREYYSQRKLQR